MKTRKIGIMLTTLFVVGLFASCQKETNEDWSEVINLYVDADWEIIPMDGIIGFHYVEGYEYLIEVEKIHITNPPADAPNIKYTLIRIISSE